jgi:hypothetical protein
MQSTSASMNTSTCLRLFRQLRQACGLPSTPAAVLGLAHHVDPGVAARGSEGDPPGGVGGVVVEDDDLQIRHADLGDQIGHEGRDGGGLVPGGHQRRHRERHPWDRGAGQVTQVATVAGRVAGAGDGGRGARPLHTAGLSQ